MKKKLSLFFLFILLFATEVNALDLRLKTDTTTFTKTSTTTPLDTTLQKKIVPTPIVTPTKVLEPEKDDEVLVPIKTEEPPEIIEIKKVIPTTIEKAPQETVQKVPVAEPTPILKPETVKETTIPIREKTILSTPTPIKENFNEVLPEILAPSDEGAGSIFNASIQTSHTVQLRVQDTEEGGKPLYSIEKHLYATFIESSHLNNFRSNTDFKETFGRTCILICRTCENKTDIFTLHMLSDMKY